MVTRAVSILTVNSQFLLINSALSGSVTRFEIIAFTMISLVGLLLVANVVRLAESARVQAGLSKQGSIGDDPLFFVAGVVMQDGDFRGSLRVLPVFRHPDGCDRGSIPLRPAGEDDEDEGNPLVVRRGVHAAAALPAPLRNLVGLSRLKPLVCSWELPAVREFFANDQGDAFAGLNIENVEIRRRFSNHETSSHRTELSVRTIHPSGPDRTWSRRSSIWF